MTSTGSTLSCSGCGWVPADDDPYPFRCANAGTDDTDHVIVRTLDVGNVKRWLLEFSRVAWPESDSPNPFVRYGSLLHAFHMGLARGMGSGEFDDFVERLDREIAAVDGRGFVETPFQRADELSQRLGFAPSGGVWVKDETGNVSGSHKARHLFGLLLHLVVAEYVGLVPDGDRPELAIASCGNAALAAAVVAKAGNRTLRVFVPTWADPSVIDRLGALGAIIEVCEREPGVPGDPTFHALQKAIAGGALPFTCQGNENGLAIEGGETLGYEMVSQLDGTSVDRVFVQVGGGALASAVLAAFVDARALGAVEALPRFHAVQTRAGHPLKRAYDLLAARILSRAGGEASEAGLPSEADAAAAVAAEELSYAARHRSEFMWPWEEVPKSIAHGILDDETYDWLAVVRGMVATGGHPVVVDETLLKRANEIGRESTGIDVDHTGTSGLAGLMELLDRGVVGSDERVAVLFTGVRRETKAKEGTEG